MSDIAVVFERVWKKFRRGERHDSLRDLIPSLFARENPNALGVQQFWAVQDVSFQVKRGEALGIIGPNGAGKSTTLKLLTKILRPTRGHCAVIGRVGTLIEVAAGFHPDLTGRENVFFQGAIMGMKQSEIARKMDQIIEFAGVRDFIETPVKRYSSGMNARLGFSVAAHLDPEVLIIDEVLSVGDSAFQERCVARMKEFKRQGVAIVFVSHNLQAVSNLCDQAILLKREVVAAGAVDSVLREYVQSQASPVPQQSNTPVSIQKATLTGETGEPVDDLNPGEHLTLRVGYSVSSDIRDVTFGFMLYRSIDRLILYEGNFADHELGLPELNAGTDFQIDFSFDAHLSRGEYFIECYVLHDPTHEFVSTLSPAAMFSVNETRTCRGIVDVGLQAKYSRPVSLVHASSSL
jgi:lipopolysaccharide transport system ATP-binding protein